MVYIGTVTAAGKASAEVLAQHNIALKTVSEVEHASDMRTLNIVCPNFDEQLACFQPVGKVPPPKDSVERASGTADSWIATDFITPRDSEPIGTHRACSPEWNGIPPTAWGLLLDPRHIVGPAPANARGTLKELAQNNFVV